MLLLIRYDYEFHKRVLVSKDLQRAQGTLDAMLWGSLWDPEDEVKQNTQLYVDEVSCFDALSRKHRTDNVPGSTMLKAGRQMGICHLPTTPFSSASPGQRGCMGHDFGDPWQGGGLTGVLWMDSAKEVSQQEALADSHAFVASIRALSLLLFPNVFAYADCSRLDR